MAGEANFCDIAVIGIAFELPQGTTSEQRLWDVVTKARLTCTDFPPERLNIDAYYHPDTNRSGNISVRGGHFLAGDLGHFDAPFFNMTQAEAACMDPQHRHMLETAYHALEDAGIPLEKCIGSDTSVFTGCFSNDYANLLQADLESDKRHAPLGVSAAMLANRLSWFFNLKGTSFNIDSACSSSLVALHLACQDLRAGNSSMALVGGANLLFHPSFMKLFSDGNFLGRDGRSYSFDDRANGYGRGEGHAVLAVKRIDDAIRDGNTIRAVIRSSGSNQDGRTPGITVPSADAQAKLIRQLFHQANLDQRPVRFFEAHGTGTPVGDPIEANAIGSAFQEYRSPEDPLYIGAFKANIGHLEGAAGLAGVIKTILVLEKGVIPPIADLVCLNREIHAEALNIKFPTKNIAWPTTGLRRACVNSFGFGGTNAAVVLDDACHYLQERGLEGFHRTSPSVPRVNGSIAPRPSHGHPVDTHRDLKKTPNSQRQKLLVFSAASRDSLQAISVAYRNYLENPSVWSEELVDDLVYTLAMRRSRLSWRSWAVVSVCDDNDSKAAVNITSTALGPAKALEYDMARVAFVFTGQGAQYLGMGQQMMVFPEFLKSLQTSEKHLKTLGCPWSVVDIIQRQESSEASIDSPELSQPVTTCLQIALVDLLESCEVCPTVVVGHSSGEIGAAYACGALSHFSAVKVAYYRGTLSARLVADAVVDGQSSFGMMAVGMSRHDVQLWMERLGHAAEDVQIGCVNSPESVTLTGVTSGLGKLEDMLKAEGIFARRLRVPLAYHSKFMSEHTDDYLMALGNDLERGAQRKATSVSMISSVTGGIITQEDLSKTRYWVRNLTSTVEFESAFSRLASQTKGPVKQPVTNGLVPDANREITHVLEIGPHSALQGPIRDCLRHTATQPVYIASLVRGRDSITTFLEATGTLLSAGFPVDLLRINQLDKTHRATPPGLPPYPFKHAESLWTEPRFSKNLRFRQASRHDLIGLPSLDWNPHVAQWRNILRIAEVSWLEDHTLGGIVVVPAAGMITMAIEAFKQLHTQKTNDELIGLYVQDAVFAHAMAFPPGQESIEIQLTLSSPPRSVEKSASHFRLFLMESGDWIECCHGLVRGVSEEEDRDRLLACGPWLDAQLDTPAQWIRDLKEQCTVSHEIYKNQDPKGLVWGQCFQNIEQPHFSTSGAAFAHVNTTSWKAKSVEGMPYPPYSSHPSTIDGLFQLLKPSIKELKGGQQVPAMMPTRIQSLWVSNGGDVNQETLLAAGSFRLRGYRGAGGNIVAIEESSQVPTLVVTGLEATFVDSGSPGDGSETQGVNSTPMCHRLEYQPDIALMNEEELLGYCARHRPMRTDVSEELVSSHDDEFHDLGKLFGLLSFKNPNMKILELGAGDGKLTHRILPAMTSGDMFRWSSYDFTDPSPDSVAAAAATLGLEIHSNRINFVPYDISMDLAPDSSMSRNYDLIVAPQNALFSGEQAASNIRGLLKPGGKLVLVGAVVADNAVHNLSTETLLKNNRSVTSFTLQRNGYYAKQLEENLRMCGFSGVDAYVPAQVSTHAHTSTVIMSTAVELNDSVTNSPAAFPEVCIVFDEHNLSQRAVADSLRSAGFSFCTLRTIDQLSNGKALSFYNAVTIFLLEYESVFLDAISETNYMHLQAAMQHTKMSLWVTKGTSETGSAYAEPRHHLSDGLGRVLMSEDSAVKFSTVNLSAMKRKENDVARIAGLIRRLALQVVNCSVQDLETSWIWSAEDGVLHVPRITENTVMEDTVEKALSERHVQELKPHRHDEDKAPPSLAMVVHSPGQPDSLEWREMEGEDTAHALQLDEVRIQVHAIGLTRRDWMVAVGQLSDSTAEIGSEIAGTVVEAGSKSGCSPGDRVMTLLGSPCRINMTVRSAIVIPVPSTLSFETAASLPFALLLAFHSLVNVARLEKGETVLIYKAETSVVHLVVQIARKLGAARVLVVAVDERQTEILNEAFAMFEVEIVSLSDMKMARRLLQPINARGVDVVLGELQDDGFLASGHVLGYIVAVCGRIIDISAKQSRSLQRGLVSGKAAENIMTSSVRVNELTRDAPTMAYRTLREAISFVFAEGEQTSLPQAIRLSIYNASQLRQAGTDFQSAKSVGKCVIRLDPAEPVEANAITRPKHPFTAEATYVIVGGFGGLGRGIVRWMASRGARNLIVLSRSGARSPQARSMVAELQQGGVRIAAPAIDISKVDSLRCTIAELTKTMPPIRGCIQGAVAVKDSLWPNMTYADWKTSLDAKATGSWNLHIVLPNDLDFFILVSSISSLIGNRGQANYSAGNAFKDALAHHRLALGQKAVSINLGLMVDEGFVAEADIVDMTRRRLQLVADLKMHEFLVLLGHYCEADRPLLPDSQAQIVFGLELPNVALQKLKGQDDLQHAVYRPIFNHLFAMGKSSAMGNITTAKREISRNSALAAAKTEGDAASLVTEWLQAKLAHMLGLTADDIPTGRPVHVLGIDSLAAIDLKNWFDREVGAEVQVFTLLGNTTLEDLAGDAAKKSRFLTVI